MPKNMWTRIFIFCGLGLLVSLFPPPAGAQPPTDGCTPDSLLFLGNDRLWRPGEPLEWASASTWAELDSLNPDGFWLIVESPRKPGYLKRIRKISAPEGHHAVYTDGDLRFISYNDGPNRSQSTLVGHNYDATPYWFNSVLHWQNGKANWFKHKQRLFHSLGTEEIEILPSIEAPDNAEDAIVMALDSLSLFIQLSGNSKEQELTTPIYCLPHTSSYWNSLGILNPVVTVLHPASKAQHLQDFIVFSNSGIMMVVRKSDLSFTEVTSPLARYRNSNYRRGKDREPNTWMAWKGNVLFYKGDDGIMAEDIAELVEGAEWEPLIVPTRLKSVPFYAQGNPEYWGWTVAIALGCITLFLSFTLLWTGRVQRKRQTPIVLPDGTEQAPLSPMVITLLTHRGKQLGAEQFDALIGLSGVHSPETRRSRRARIIQVANAEATARFGQPLIEREKSASDKRVVLYKIRDVSDPT